jgi:F0F1-type ATP synthase membrane subunit b/b'
MKNLTDKAQSRLYALTSLACIVWLVQSSIEASNDGSIWTLWNIFFSICLLVVIGWTGWEAITMMIKNTKEEDGQDDEDVEDPRDEEEEMDAESRAELEAADAEATKRQ